MFSGYQTCTIAWNMDKATLARRGSGPLVIVGGAEDKHGECLILREFARLAGGADARIAVVTVASEYPRQVGLLYAELFEELGARSVRVVHVERREDADAPSAVRALSRASGIFFTGGTQSRVPRLLGGSVSESAIHKRHRAGAVLGGTSAGAAAMSRVMIVEGLGARSPRIGSAKKETGLGFLGGVIVDQHFTERGRLGLLLFALAEHPGELGLGIDENTAVVVEGDEFVVIGENAVTVVDASSLSYTNLDELDEDERALAPCDVKLHVLPAGHRFNLRKRRPVLPTETAIGRLRSASA